jgi:acyl-CoA reductase-like NAD-dependent aldehyde dehydrogenase
MCEIGDQSTSNTEAKVDDARQRKKEREKGRWAAMTQEERDEKNKKISAGISP